MRNSLGVFLGLVLACAPELPVSPPRVPRQTTDARLDVRDAGIETAGDARDAGSSDRKPSDVRTDVPPDERQDTGSGAPDGGLQMDVGTDLAAVRDTGSEVTGAVEPRPGDIAIVELLVNPLGTDQGREWIELANQSSLALDLTRLQLADLISEAPLGLGRIEPGVRVVVGQSTDAAKNGGAPVAATYGVRISLNNDSDTISLCLGSCSSGLVLTSVAWTSAEISEGRSLILAGGKRCLGETMFGTAGDRGGPGLAETSCP